MASEKVNNGITNFGTNLLKKGVEKTSNGIVAAFSVASVLGMTLVGAMGLTANQIKAALTTAETSSYLDSNDHNQKMDASDEDEVDGFMMPPDVVDSSQPSTEISSSFVTNFGSNTDSDISQDSNNESPPKKSKMSTLDKLKRRFSGKQSDNFDVENEVFHQILGGFITQSESNRGYTLCSANKIYVKKNGALSKQYFQVVQKYYGSTPVALNFSGNTEKCRREINTWVSEQTRSKIPELLAQGSLSAETSIVIVNAIYFKGKWESQFDPRLTSQKTFATLSGGKRPTDMMHQTGSFPYRVDPTTKTQVLELPYVNRDLSFFVMLPNSSEEFLRLRSNLNAATINRLLDGLSEHEISVYLPKFKVDVALELSGVLRSLGIPDLFIPDTANLEKIEPKGTLYVSGVVHQAFIEVNEEGSEAAAATAEIVRAAGAPMQRTVFKADHPFFFMIRDNRKNAVLFLGQFCQPA